MKVVVAADSLALPRPRDVRTWRPGEELGVRVEDTYSYLLERALREALPGDDVIVMNRGVRHQTMPGIAAEVLDLVHNMEPDVLVVQAGIVDCWPRVELAGGPRVPLQDSTAGLTSVVAQLALRPAARLVVLGICPTSRHMESRFPGTLQRIAEYNTALEGVCDRSGHLFIDLAAHVDPDDPQLYLMPDDNHLNRDGHRLVARLLTSGVLSVNTPPTTPGAATVTRGDAPPGTP